MEQRRRGMKDADNDAAMLKATDDPRLMMPWQILAERREQLGVRQADLARRLGYHYPNFISMIESSKSPVPIDRAREFARALDLPETWFTAQVLKSSLAKDNQGLHEWLFGQGDKLN